MSISLNIGLKSLLSSQRALETVGHNISNANTPGYSRQVLDLRASRPLDQGGVLIGNGVDAEGVRRLSDDVLGRRLTQQSGVVARYEGLLTSLSGLESLLSEPGGAGVSAAFESFFESVSALASNPADSVLRNAVVESAESLTATFQQLSGSIEELAIDGRSQAQALGSGVNNLADQIAELNVEIGTLEAGGGAANDLRDQRELALGQLAELVEIDVQPKPSGVVHVLIEGQLLVGSSQAYGVTPSTNEDGSPVLLLEGGTRAVNPDGGQLGGIIQFLQESVPALQEGLGSIVQAITLEVNRAHSVGVPGSGGFQSLTSSSPLGDPAQGDLLAQTLGGLDLVFPVQDGFLQINSSNDATGEVISRRIEIDPSSTTVQDLLDELDAVPSINANLDSLGRLSIRATSGNRFDFSARQDRAPDNAGTFGAGQATLVSNQTGPYALNDGDTLQLVGPGGPFSITLDAADFADITSATAEELSAAISAEAGAVSGQVQAVAVADRLVLQSIPEGGAAALQVVGGTALGALGLQAGSSTTGFDTAVNPEIVGEFSGSENATWTFRPLGDGVVGSTPGLQVEVRDANGQPVGTLDVGEGYQPGSNLNVADGISVRLNFGQLSATDGDFFESFQTADPDSSDLLVAVGLNSFFVGTSADDFSVAQSIKDDPRKIAASGTGAVGDNRALLNLLRLQTEEVDSLGQSLSASYGGLVSDLGSDVAGASNRLNTEQFLLDSLEGRRDELSGVNVDEELVDLIRFEQAFGAAARFISVVQQVDDTLLSLL